MEVPVASENNKIEFIDVLDIEESKEDVVIPYFTNLYKNLILRSDDPIKGIPRVILCDVLS